MGRPHLRLVGGPVPLESSVDPDLLAVALCNIARLRFLGRKAHHVRAARGIHLVAWVADERGLVPRGLARTGGSSIGRPVASGDLRADPDLASLLQDILNGLLKLSLLGLTC